MRQRPARAGTPNLLFHPHSDCLPVPRPWKSWRSLEPIFDLPYQRFGQTARISDNLSVRDPNEIVDLLSRGARRWIDSNVKRTTLERGHVGPITSNVCKGYDIYIAVGREITADHRSIYDDRVTPIFSDEI